MNGDSNSYCGGNSLIIHPGEAHRLVRDFSRHQQQRNLRPRTIEARRSTLRAFAAVQPDLLKATWRDIEAWLDRPLSAKSRADYLSYLHCFYQWAIRAELTTVDPTVHILPPKIPKHLPRPISERDLIRAFMEADRRMLAMLALAAYAGLRCMEIAGLEVTDIIWATPVVLWIRGKGDKERVVPLAQRAQLALRSYGLPNRGPVFHRLDGGPYTAGTISRMINRHLHQCGLTETAHQLRHRFGTRVYGVSRDIVLTQEMMGHASIATTRGYVAFCPEDAAKTIDAI